MSDHSVNITINAGGDAARYLNEILKASNGIADAGKRMGGGVNGGGSPTGKDVAKKVESGLDNVATALGGSGGAVAALARLGPYAATAAAAVMALDASVAMTTKGLNTLNDSTKSAAQKMNAFGDEFIPFYRQMREFAEAVAGWSDQLVRRQDRHDIDIARLGVQAKFQGQMATSAFNVEEARHRGAVIGSHPLAQHQMYNLGTVQGRIGYAEQRLTLGSRDAVTHAERGADAAKRDRRAAEEMFRTAKRERDAVAGQLGGALERSQRELDRENEGWGRNKVRRDDAAKESLRLQKELEMAEQKMAQEMDRVQQARLNHSKALTDLTAKRVELHKAELSVLEQQEGRMSGLRKSLGGMTQGEANYSAAMLKMIANRGVEDLPPGVVNAAGKLAPEFVAAEQEKLGEKRMSSLRGRFTPQEMERIFGKAEARGETLDATRNRMQKVQADMRVIVELDTQRVARELKDGLQGYIRDLVKQLRLEQDSAERLDRLGKADARNQQN